jgi:multicomponent Na+:H+ antiporter subunit C
VTTVAILSATALPLFALALYALFVRRHLMQKLIGAGIAGSSVFLFLVASPGWTADGAPDPVPQAMALTGIVISIAVVAYALSLLRRIAETTGRITLPEDDPSAPPDEDA